MRELVGSFLQRCRTSKVFWRINTTTEAVRRNHTIVAPLCMIASVIALTTPTAAYAGLGYITHWSRYDTSGANAAYNGPTDVAFLKSNGNLLIVDSNAGVTSGGEVVVQQVDGTYVTKVAALNNQGPVRITVDSNSGDVYIGTYYDAKVRRFTEAGGALTLTDTWTGCTANGGNGPYTWGKTFGVAVDSTGAIYVNDYDGLRIIKMNAAGQCLAAPLTTYTKNGTPGQVFLNLTGLAVDSADNLWASDYGKKVIVKYDSAGTWQTTLTGYTNCGTTTAFSSPKDIDIDPATNDIFITDSGATMGIVKLDSSGNFLTKTNKYNTNTSLSSAFGSGYSSGYLYATDYGHSAVVKYQNASRMVSVTASANGTVAADAGGNIVGTTNGNTCVDQFVEASTVTLTATPSAGYTVTWGGADGAGCTGNTCTLSNIASNKVVTASFALPAVNGACGAVAATSFRPAANLCTTGSLNAAGVIKGASSWTWACDGSNGGTSTAANACSASFGQTATNSGGAATQVVSGGSWAFTASGTGPLETAGFISTTGHVKSPPTLPSGYTFPHGLFDFVLDGGTPGTAATVAITYPTAIPSGAVYWKYGPSPAGYNCSGAACATPHWYQMPSAQAVFAGNTVTLTITDGGVGDDDLAANGVIIDQGGPGVPIVTPPSGGTVGVPTLSDWGMIILGCLIALVGYLQMGRRVSRPG